MKKKITIDLFTYTFNDEDILPYFLKHYSFVDQMTFIDSGSTDRTRQILDDHASKGKQHIRLMPTGLTWWDHETLHKLRNSIWKESQFDYVFFPVHSPSLFDPAVSSGVFDGWMNLYNPKIAGNPSYPGTPRNGFLTPFPYVKEVLYQLHQEFGISIEEDTFFDAEMKKLVFWTDQAINSSYRVPERGWEGQLLLSFLYKNIVPGIKVADQIKDLRYLFNVIIDYNSRKSSIRILSCNSLLASNDLDDINSKVLYGYEYSVKIVKYSFDYTMFVYLKYLE
jgi:hypothetical protein